MSRKKELEFVCDGCGQIVSTSGVEVLAVLSGRVLCKAGHMWKPVEKPGSAMACFAVNVLRTTRERWSVARVALNAELDEASREVEECRVLRAA